MTDIILPAAGKTTSLDKLCALRYQYPSVCLSLCPSILCAGLYLTSQNTKVGINDGKVNSPSQDTSVTHTHTVTHTHIHPHLEAWMNVFGQWQEVRGPGGQGVRRPVVEGISFNRVVPNAGIICKTWVTFVLLPALSKCSPLNPI